MKHLPNHIMVWYKFIVNDYTTKKILKSKYILKVFIYLYLIPPNFLYKKLYLGQSLMLDIYCLLSLTVHCGLELGVWIQQHQGSTWHWGSPSSSTQILLSRRQKFWDVDLRRRIHKVLAFQMLFWTKEMLLLRTSCVLHCVSNHCGSSQTFVRVWSLVQA